MRNLITIALLVFCLPIVAQQIGPNVSWDKETHDFGEIKEADGKVTHKFEFTNTGNEPLVVTNVRPSCGCTSSDYTKEPVMPGAKGYVSATFNPLRRPGKFSKTITITTNTEKPTTILRFTGNVIQKPKSKEELHPRKLGNLNVKTNHLALGSVKNTDIKTDQIPMINLTDAPIQIEFKNVPSHLKIKALPAKLNPNEEGKIVVTFNAEMKNDWGFVMDKITVLVNGETDDNKNRISVSASITEDFSGINKADAPIASFDNKVFNFGKIRQGEKVSHNFNLTNSGKSDLIIRKTKASCGCTLLNLDKKVIAPGETATFDVTFDSNGKKNRQNKSITVITNDPNNSQISLRISGEVEVPN